MATLALAAVGSAIGATTGATFVAAIGAQIGTYLGGQIDSVIFGPEKLRSVTGTGVEALAVQTSTYGKMIPIVYGTVRIAGNVIWSLPIQETQNTTTVSAGGKGGSSVEQDVTTYSYTVTLAIAVCEGVIDEIVRVWADAKILDPQLGTWRLYKGDEAQLPDPLIEATQGVGKTPAYRGMAYVVIENFPLAAYGNRIPNFTFEVRRRVIDEDENGDTLENLITAVVMIPGSGEFVYDTQTQTKLQGEQVGPLWVQGGSSTVINQNNRSLKADALVALDQLESTLPNVNWVAVVVTWFGTDIDAVDCEIYPGVEYQTGAITEPETWSVGSFTRATAHQITLDINGNPVYGGTPDDQSVVRYLQELKLRGYNILFLPMFFMDTANKPWRGRVTGSPTEVANFFTKTNGYNAFITHYANLVKDYVDAFSIGSELIGLTKVKDGSNNFPAVSALVSLAATVRSLMPGVDLTYAADWSEYHHTDGGWYNLDPLWASPNIDFIGIDAYFPLADAPQSNYDIQTVIDGWTSGEGYDFYYTDPGRTTTAPLAPAYAWKNIQWWWQNTHVNPDASTTAWVPQSKKIWFTEYGFPSVDNAINQPNVFYDPSSSESFFPRFSRGRVDLLSQRQGLLGTEKKWVGSSMIERKFIWTWDARPFPFWPDLKTVWTDGDLWKTGHWISGKLGLSGLAAIVRDLSLRAGFSVNDFDVSRLLDLVDGYVLTDQITVRAAIEQLQAAYFFDAVESGDTLRYIPRGNDTIASIVEDDLIASDSDRGRDLVKVTRRQELEIPATLDVLFMSRNNNYQTGDERATRMTTESEETLRIALPIVMTEQQAKTIAETALYNTWLARTRYECQLPMAYADLEPADVIEVASGAATHRLRITHTDYGRPGVVRVRGVAEDAASYDFYASGANSGALPPIVAEPGETRAEFLDIPLLPGDEANTAQLRIATQGYNEGWRGAVLYRSDDGGANYQTLLSLGGAILGNATTTLGVGVSHVIDEVNSVNVTLLSGELESTTELGLLNGANGAVLGNEIIQFRTATLIGPYKYTLTGLLRGRLGTERDIANHAAGDRFVLLTGQVGRLTIHSSLFGLSRPYKAVSIGETLGSTSAENFTYGAIALKPYSPVHLIGARDGGGNLTANWVRRTRSGGEWRDAIDVPLSETSEAYEAEILDGSNVVVRTITNLSTPSFTYSAANQTIDFGAPQASIKTRIYQISTAVGRGFPAEAIL